AGRQQQLVWHDPDVNGMHVVALEVDLAMLAARSCRERVIVAGPELVDVAHGVDVRELALEHERANDEIVVAVDVVAAPRAAEDFVTEYSHPPEAGAAGLVGSEVEAGVADENGFRMSADVGGVVAGRDELVEAALGVAQDKRVLHGIFLLGL